MNTDLRALLNEVAEGRIDPTAAAAMIDELQPAAASDPSAPEQPADVLTLVRLTSSARPVRVIADSSVATFTVEGPHSVRHDGSTVRIDANRLAGGAAEAGSYRFERKGGLTRWFGQNTLVGVPVTLRVHPDLAVEIEVMAGALDVTGFRAAVDFSVTAGSVRVADCGGPVTGSVRAGSAKLDVRPTHGRSSVRVESGSVDLRLQPGSDVRLHGRADLGEIKIKYADSSTRVVHGEGLEDLVVGAGKADFELDVAMGSVKVRLP